MKPGDACVILPDNKVQHYGCNMYADGVVTDVRTGKVVSTR